MTELLKKAIEHLSNLPPTEQDAYAAMILAELEDERRWDASFERSRPVLDRLAAEAVEDDREGRTVAGDW